MNSEEKKRLVILGDDTGIDDAWIRWLAWQLNDVASVSIQHLSAADGQSLPTQQPWKWFLPLEKHFAKPSAWQVPDSFALNKNLDRTADMVLDVSSTRDPMSFTSDSGLWWLAVGDVKLGAGRLAGYREVVDYKSVTELALYYYSRESSGSPQERAGSSVVSGVYNTRWCGVVNRNLVMSKVPLLIKKALLRVADKPDKHGAPVLTRVGASSVTSDQSASLGREPLHTLSVLRQLSRMLSYYWTSKLSDAQRRFERRPGMWSLFFGVGDFQHHALDQLQESRPKSNEYWADPFLFYTQNRLFVFFEVYDYPTALGRIAVGEWNGTEMQVLGDVLALDYHLSYPFIIEHEGEIILIPECSQANRVEVWRCIDFPLKFERIATCFEGSAIADLTLFCKDGQWWAFCTMKQHGVADMNSELYAFAVDGPLMQSIVPHSQNPIVADSRFARPAGRIFQRNGCWYRPSQNNSHGVYGYGLNLMRINTLSLQTYEEELVRSVSPDFALGLVATHHLDQQEDIFVIDGCRSLGGKAFPPQSFSV